MDALAALYRAFTEQHIPGWMALGAVVLIALAQACAKMAGLAMRSRRPARVTTADLLAGQQKAIEAERRSAREERHQMMALMQAEVKRAHQKADEAVAEARRARIDMSGAEALHAQCVETLSRVDAELALLKAKVSS
jgi:hypothetical protein